MHKNLLFTERADYLGVKLLNRVSDQGAGVREGIESKVLIEGRS